MSAQVLPKSTSDSRSILHFTYSIKDKLEEVLVKHLKNANLFSKYTDKVVEVSSQHPQEPDLNKWRAMIEIFTTARLFNSAYIAALILSVVVILKQNKIQTAIPYIKRAYNLWTVIHKSGDWQSFSPYERVFELYKHKSKLELNDFLYLVLREILKYCASKTGIGSGSMSDDSMTLKNKL